MLVKHKIWHKSDNELLRHSFMLVSDTIDRSMPKLKYVSIQSLSSFLKQLQGEPTRADPKTGKLEHSLMDNFFRPMDFYSCTLCATPS